MHQLPVLNLNCSFVHNCMLSWQFSMLFSNVSMWKVLTGCTIVFWYRFGQNENGISLSCLCGFFSFGGGGVAPSNIYLGKFCKTIQKKALHHLNLILWFSDWKHVRPTPTCIRTNLSWRKFLKTMFWYFWKSGHSLMAFITDSMHLQ